MNDKQDNISPNCNYTHIHYHRVQWWGKFNLAHNVIATMCPLNEYHKVKFSSLIKFVRIIVTLGNIDQFQE